MQSAADDVTCPGSSSPERRLLGSNARRHDRTSPDAGTNITGTAAAPTVRHDGRGETRTLAENAQEQGHTGELRQRRRQKRFDEFLHLRHYDRDNNDADTSVTTAHSAGADQFTDGFSSPAVHSVGSAQDTDPRQLVEKEEEEKEEKEKEKKEKEKEEKEKEENERKLKEEIRRLMTENRQMRNEFDERNRLVQERTEKERTAKENPGEEERKKARAEAERRRREREEEK